MPKPFLQLEERHGRSLPRDARADRGGGAVSGNPGVRFPPMTTERAAAAFAMALLTAYRGRQVTLREADGLAMSSRKVSFTGSANRKTESLSNDCAMRV